MGNFSSNSFPTNRWQTGDTLDTLPNAIASIDAAIRNLFGVSASALSAAFAISDAGAVRVLNSLQIGATTEPVISDIVTTIPSSPGPSENTQLATVGAMRAFFEAQ